MKCNFITVLLCFVSVLISINPDHLPQNTSLQAQSFELNTRLTIYATFAENIKVATADKLINE